MSQDHVRELGSTAVVVCCLHRGGRHRALAMQASSLRATGKHVFVVAAADDEHASRTLRAHADTFVAITDPRTPPGVVADALVSLASVDPFAAQRLVHAIGDGEVVFVHCDPGFDAPSGERASSVGDQAAAHAFRAGAAITGLAWRVRSPSPISASAVSQLRAHLLERFDRLDVPIQGRATVDRDLPTDVQLFARLRPRATPDDAQSGAAAAKT